MEVGTRSTSNGRANRDDRWAVPLLDARRGGPAERFAGRLRGRHPAAVFFAALLAGFAVLGLISIALGLLVTDVLLDTGGLSRTDESIVESIVAERTPFLTDVSEVGSTVGGAPLLPILVGAIALVCAVLREVADRGLRCLRAGGRVGDLPRHVAGGAARASRRQAARGPPRRRQLPVRSHGRRRSRSTSAWSCC